MTILTFPTQTESNQTESTQTESNQTGPVGMQQGARTAPPVGASADHAAMAGLTSGLLLQVVLVHLIDQEWFAFTKGPAYVQAGYIAVEVVGLITAVLLLTRRHWLAWAAAFATAAGPLFGFIVSRSVGMPGYTDDIGNWTEPLGVASVLIEFSVMLIAARVLLGAWRRRSM